MNYNIAELYTVFIQTDTTGRPLPAPLVRWQSISHTQYVPDPQYKG